MTEYDAHKLYKEQQERDRVTSLHADNGHCKFILQMVQWKSGRRTGEVN